MSCEFCDDSDGSSKYIEPFKSKVLTVKYTLIKVTDYLIVTILSRTPPLSYFGT